MAAVLEVDEPAGAGSGLVTGVVSFELVFVISEVVILRSFVRLIVTLLHEPLHGAGMDV